MSLSPDLFDPPIKSLGWALLDWLEAFLRVPDGPRVGEPFVLEGWQAEFLLRWYQVDDRGRWLFRRGAMQLAKGSGKSPFAAGLALAEFCGPTVFAGWDANGMPAGRRHPTPWVQVAAVSLDATDNTFAALYRMVADSPLVDEYKLDLGRTRIYLPGAAGRIEPVTMEAGSREGQRLTAAILDETHYWTPTTGGRKLAEVLRRNVAKMGGRTVETTNAYEPGAGTVAEGTHRAADNGREGILFTWLRAARQVLDVKDPGQLRPALAEVYADCPWVDVDRIVEECLDPDMAAVQVRRFYLNEVVATEARFVRDDTLDAVLDPSLELEEGAPIGVGFDGSKTRDGTAVVGVHMVSGEVFLLGAWVRPPWAPREWEVPRHEVMDLLRVVFDRYQVVRAKFDPAYWRDELSQLQQQFGKDVVDRFPTSVRQVVDEAVEACQTRLEQAAREGRKVICGDPDEHGAQPLVDGLRAAQVVVDQVGQRGYRKLVKPSDGRLIDCAAAFVYAEQARREAFTRGWAPAAAAVAPFVVWAD